MWTPRDSLLLLLGLLGACSKEGESQAPGPCQPPASATPVEAVAIIERCHELSSHVLYSAPRSGNLDVLFVIDNSSGMLEKQQALLQGIPAFLRQLDDADVNYHIGVVSTDVGTFVAPAQPFSTPFPRELAACATFAGDNGVLRRRPCTEAAGLSDAARAACNAACPDPGFVPLDGKGYIERRGGITNVRQQVLGGQDVGPRKAFACLAMLGDAGCGIEAPLEAARRALASDGLPKGNEGFLRPDSVLAVIFMTDEDDCSVAMSRRSENDPTVKECRAPDKEAPAACFNPDYRCLARSLICNEALNTPSRTGEDGRPESKSNCVEREGSYLTPVTSYVDFFTSIRPPNRLVIAGIWAPRGGKLIVLSKDGSGASPSLDRGRGRDASCAYPGNSQIFAMPQVRLSRLADLIGQRGAGASIEIDVCALDEYQGEIERLAQVMTRRLRDDTSCLPAAPRSEGGAPLCVVGEVDELSPLSLPERRLASCSATCCEGFAQALPAVAHHPLVRAACQAEGPCFCAVKGRAGQCPGGAVAGVWRRGVPDPGKAVRFLCAR